MLPEKLSVYFNLCNIINGRQPHVINTIAAKQLHDHISQVETNVYFHQRRDILVPKQKIYKGGRPEGNSVGNPTSNSVGNSIGNPVGNPVGDPVGVSPPVSGRKTLIRVFYQ